MAGLDTDRWPGGVVRGWVVSVLHICWHVRRCPQERLEMGDGSALRRGRLALRRWGLDVRRFPTPNSASDRRAKLLSARGIDVVLDVGGGTGGYAEDLRRHGYGNRIVSLEPLGNSFSQLEHLAARDPKWEVVNCALGATAGRAVLNVAANADSSSLLRMLPTHARAAPDAAYVGIEDVEVITMEAVLEDHVPSGSTVFAKLDVQGFERQVLAAAPIDRITGFELELSLVPLYADSMLFLEAIALLAGHDFELFSTAAAFTDPTTGRLLQMDGIFFRPDEPVGRVAPGWYGS